MKNIGSKFLIINVAILVGIFSLFFISSPKVQAQNEEKKEAKMTIRTTHYSVLSSTVFVLGGAYSGNTEKKPLTTYFEFKRDDSDLNTAEGREETIPIVRNDDAEESGEFYASPELHISATYYFRAVGYYNDNPDRKFYGWKSSLRTGSPFLWATPFTIEFYGLEGQEYRTMPYISPICPPLKFLKKGVCVDEIPLPPVFLPPQDLNPSDIILKSSDIKVTPSPSISPYTPISPSSGAPSSSSKMGFTGDLIPCDGTNARPCDFNALMTLIDNIIKFILFNLALPIAAIMFAIAGFLLITTGGADGKTRAKNIFTNTVIGLIFAAGAFLIVKTILSILGYNGTLI